MSYIDSFDHEYIGSLGYLPIYHPLQTIATARWGDYDFGATPDNLVLGGGSGEHSGLVLHKLESMVAMFLYDQLSEDEDDELAEADRQYILSLISVYHYHMLEFCEWSIREYARLASMATSSALHTPCSEDQSVEDWLCKSIGELVYYSLPELNPQHDKLKSIFSSFRIMPTMRNVIISPPGYPSEGGRIVKNDKVIWGKHRW